MPRLIEEDIFSACLRPYAGNFAGGQQANNKLECEILEHHPVLREVVVDQMGLAVMRHEPDFVVGIPRGATWLAKAIAKEKGLAVVRLDYESEDPQKNMYFYSAADEEVCRNGSRGVIVEDVFNRFTNTRRALAIEGLASRIVAAEAIIDRGDTSSRKELLIATDARIKKHIPSMLTPGSALWKYISR